MGQYLIDNNVISSYFSEAFSEKAMDFLTEIIDLIPNISVITEIEALSWVNKDTSKEKIIQEFIRDANVIPLTPAVVNECVALRPKKKNQNTGCYNRCYSYRTQFVTYYK